MAPHLLAVLAAVVALGCSRERMAFTKQHVGTLPYVSTREQYYSVSQDGTHFAVIERVPGGQRVIENGMPQPFHGEIADLRYAGESNVLLYFAADSRLEGERLVLVADGRETPVDFVHRGPIATAPDGRRWIVTDREPPGPDGAPGRVVLLHDDGTMHRWADATVPAFSADGRHVAYLAEDGDGAVHLVVDGGVRRSFGRPEGKCAPIVKPAVRGPTLPPQYAARFLADGSVLALTRDTACWTVWRDDLRLAAYPTLHPGRQFDTVVISPDFAFEPSMLADPIAVAAAAPIAAWWERLRGPVDTWRLVANGAPIDGETCSRYWDDGLVSLSADGRHALYGCYAPAPPGDTFDDLFVVHDGRRHGPFKHLFAPTLSADGARTAWASAGAGDDPWRFHLDGAPVGPPYDHAFPPVFSPDGRHVAWVGIREDEARLVVDGRAIATVDRVLRPPRVGNDGSVVAIVRRDRRLTRLTWRRVRAGLF